MGLAAAIAIVSNWNSILAGLVTGEQNAVAAWDEIKSVLAARGIQADTDAIDKVIADATARKAREDALLDSPVSPV